MRALTGAADLLAIKASKGGAPTSVTFQVTDRCNYSCEHCFQLHEDKDELSFEQIEGILGQLCESQVLFLTLMGGEFFMRPDADRIIELAHGLGFALSLKTTGHHVHERRADFLSSMRPLQVSLSVYGAGPEVHEHVTRQKGSWARTRDAAIRLIERNVPVTLNAPVMESNSQDLDNLVRLANEIGADYSFDPKITAVQDGDLSSVTLRMSDSTLKHFYGHDMDGYLRTAYAGFDPTKPHRPLDESPCSAGRQVCFINPQGEVWPCIAVPIRVGDLKTEPFKDIWFQSKPLADVRHLKWAAISECNVCEIRTYCQRCHGMALVEEGVLKGPSLEACRHAVIVRDSLRERGLIPETETQLPPTWDRVDSDGQHSLKSTDSRGKRSRALRVLA